MNLLHTIGLMTRAEHERLMDAYRDDWKFDADQALEQRDYFEAKFKRAAADLAAQAEEIAGLMEIANYRAEVIEQLQDEIVNLRPDAEAMRKKRAADRKRMAGKRGKDNG